MLYFLQTQSLKIRFLTVLLLAFPVLGFSWLLSGTPWGLAQLRIYSNGAGLPDMQFWYTPQALQTLLESWTDRGRLHYLTVLWPSDLGFLVSYGLFLTAAVLYLLKKANPAGPWWYLLAFLPLAAAGCDFLENAGVALAALFHPDGAGVLGWPAAVFTAGKWSALGLTLAVLAGGTLVHLVRQAAAKFRASRPPVSPAGPPDASGGPSLN